MSTSATDHLKTIQARARVEEAEEDRRLAEADEREGREGLEYFQQQVAEAVQRKGASEAAKEVAEEEFAEASKVSEAKNKSNHGVAEDFDPSTGLPPGQKIPMLRDHIEFVKEVLATRHFIGEGNLEEARAMERKATATFHEFEYHLCDPRALCCSHGVSGTVSTSTTHVGAPAISEPFSRPDEETLGKTFEYARLDENDAQTNPTNRSLRLEAMLCEFIGTTRRTPPDVSNYVLNAIREQRRLLAIGDGQESNVQDDDAGSEGENPNQRDEGESDEEDDVQNDGGSDDDNEDASDVQNDDQGDGGDDGNEEDNDAFEMSEDAWNAVELAVRNQVARNREHFESELRLPRETSAPIARFNQQKHFNFSSETARRSISALDDALATCSLRRLPENERRPFQYGTLGTLDGFDVDEDLIAMCGDMDHDCFRSYRHYVASMSVPSFRNLETVQSFDQLKCALNGADFLDSIDCRAMQPNNEKKGNEAFVRCVAEGRNNRIWASSSSTGTIHGFNASTGEYGCPVALLSFDEVEVKHQKQYCNPCYDLCLAGENIIGSSGTNRLSVWNIAAAVEEYSASSQLRNNGDEGNPKSSDEDNDSEDRASKRRRVQSCRGMSPKIVTVEQDLFATGDVHCVSPQNVVVGPARCFSDDSERSLSIRLFDLQAERINMEKLKIMTEEELFDPAFEHMRDIKLSRVAVVPQVERRDRIILNLSAEVDLGSTRSKKRERHPSVNETTEPAEDQTGVKALGSATKSVLRFAFDVDPEWEIEWRKIDLSDGFWRMIVEHGQEYGFCFQLPKRSPDEPTQYVVPSSLQMGWMNSPAYFCTATEGGRALIMRLMALTVLTGLNQPHKWERHAIERTKDFATIKQYQQAVVSKWTVPRDDLFFHRVFVDDYMDAIAGPVNRPNKAVTKLWQSRCSMHGIHAIFPPPDVLNHKGGKDSISKKKLEKDDACYKYTEKMLGLNITGRPGQRRVVQLPKSKYEKYDKEICKLLERKTRQIMGSELSSVGGKLQFTSQTIPCSKGFMQPIYDNLGDPRRVVGLGERSELRETLVDFRRILSMGQIAPTHIAEIVPPSLPHDYGMVDACGHGLGGVLLPCTSWIQPTVWRLPLPSHLSKRVEDNKLTMADCETAASLCQQLLRLHLAPFTEGRSSHDWSDNSPTVGTISRQKTKAKSRLPRRTLRLLGFLQRFYRQGPYDVQHWEGITNNMADIASRSFHGQYMMLDDDLFMEYFSQRFPLPPQLGSWTLVHPPTSICSAVISMLEGANLTSMGQEIAIGKIGLSLPEPLAKILSLEEPKGPPAQWNESGCSWPLLMPSGEVNSTMDELLRLRPSRQRFENVEGSWSSADMMTLAKSLKEQND